MTRHSHQKSRVGVVVSNKMQKTVVVAVETFRHHRLYRKILRRTHRFKAHDENNACAPGDLVRIVETRPLSKEKRWRVAEIVTRGQAVEVAPREIDAELIGQERRPSPEAPPAAGPPEAPAAVAEPVEAPAAVTEPVEAPAEAPTAEAVEIEGEEVEVAEEEVPEEPPAAAEALEVGAEEVEATVEEEVSAQAEDVTEGATEEGAPATAEETPPGEVSS